MRYVIADSEGSTLDSFDDEAAALAAFRDAAEEHPDRADELFLLTYSDDGEPLGETVTVDDIAAVRCTVDAGAVSLSASGVKLQSVFVSYDTRPEVVELLPMMYTAATGMFADPPRLRPASHPRMSAAQSGVQEESLTPEPA